MSAFDITLRTKHAQTIVQLGAETVSRSLVKRQLTGEHAPAIGQRRSRSLLRYHERTSW